MSVAYADAAGCLCFFFLFFFFNDTATTEIYTLSLHDALPIYRKLQASFGRTDPLTRWIAFGRSEEHTSVLQSRSDLVCRLLLEKKKKNHQISKKKKKKTKKKKKKKKKQKK